MGKYRISRFVCVDDSNEREDVYFYNIKSISIAKMSRSYYARLKSALDERNLVVNKNTEYLINEGYLVKEDDDTELREVDLKYIQTCHGKDSLMLTILPTEGCNFRCEYCYEEHKQNVMSKETQQALIDFVKRNINSYMGLSVSWFGGEPLLYPEIIEHLSKEFKEICKTCRKPYSAIMTTNGYLLDYDMFKRMKKCRVLNYQITLDGMPEVHDSQRFLVDHSPTFDRIMENLKEIKVKEKSFMYSFDIRTNLTANSLATYPEFVELLKKTLLDDNRFKQRVRIAWNGTNDDEYEKKMINNSDITAIDFWKNHFQQMKEQIGGNKNTDQVRDAFLREMISLYPCYAAKSNSFIFGPDGRVFKCTVHFDDSKEGVIGYLDASGQLIENKDIHTRWTTRNVGKDRDICYNCVVYPICQGVSCPYKTSILQSREECKNTITKLISLFYIYSYNEGLCHKIEEE
jgi:uncharacterized protein